MEGDGAGPIHVQVALAFGADSAEGVPNEGGAGHLFVIPLRDVEIGVEEEERVDYGVDDVGATK